MKAEELMIGDWVYCNYPSIKKNVRVDQIRRGGDDELKIVIVDVLPLVFTPEDIDPIPLTPEILEKNGFGYIKHDGEELTHFYPGEPQFCRDMDLHIGTDNKGHYWLNYRANDIYGLHSVHELQHAIPLCGIEKEIVL